MISISKEKLNTLPVEHYEGEIFIVDTLEDADMVAGCLKEANLIGFDTETKPSFHKGAVNKIALLQLYAEGKCYLVRLNKIGLPNSIKQILEDENIIKIGLSIKDDFLNLSKICTMKPGGFIDLQNFVKQYDIADAALARIYAILFNKRISKSAQLSNWEASQLTDKQQQYAALDAAACIKIFNHLNNGLFSPEKSEYRIEDNK